VALEAIRKGRVILMFNGVQVEDIDAPLLITPVSEARFLKLSAGRRLTMATELQRLSAALSARLQELGCAPTDPRVAPLLAQVQALMREHLAGLQAAGNVAVLPLGGQSAASAAPGDVSNGAVSYDLPADLARCVEGLSRDLSAEIASRKRRRCRSRGRTPDPGSWIRDKPRWRFKPMRLDVGALWRA
jgi:hypothetical protein